MNLKEYIEKENLLLPDYNNLNIVDLVKCLYRRYGVKCTETLNIKKLDQVIPHKKHTVFILIDGMGSNLINILNSDSLLKKNKIMDIQTVSPSSTGCVLTTLATATYPSEHGIIGWYNYNRKYNIDYYPLLFKARRQDKSLEEFNITTQEIFKESSKLNNLNVKTTVLYQDYIYNSVYSNYVANNSIRKSYTTLEDAFSKILEITSLNEETFTYLYISSVDDLEHQYGFDHEIVIKEIKKIEEELKRLNNNDDVAIIITADHGQVNVKQDIVMDFAKYDQYFYAYPGIDFGMATYYVKDGKEEEFLNEFNKDFKGRMTLFKTEEFINNKVFGPNTNNTYLLNNLGEYISLCASDGLFINSLDTEKYYGKIKGNHSGLTKGEMIIPLIVITKD